jgi:hypothetical protein
LWSGTGDAAKLLCGAQTLGKWPTTIWGNSISSRTLNLSQNTSVKVVLFNQTEAWGSLISLNNLLKILLLWVLKAMLRKKK